MLFCIIYTFLAFPRKGDRKKVSKGAKIRNQYNQVPHLTQDTNGKEMQQRKHLPTVVIHGQTGNHIITGELCHCVR